ncbi:MAG TPA: hypothetical protein VFK05_06885 [Polyangiaceae bacterium]|nr:hypothetical protein [Polyangiaceae bacterium]
MTCASLETIAGWVLGELPEAQAIDFEEHYFVCSTCFARAERLLELERTLRSALPPVLTAERTRELVARVPALTEVHLYPGERGVIQLGEAAPLGVWYLHCDLQGVSSVDLEAHSARGETLFRFADVPFDAQRGLVAMPCHLHYRALGTGPEFHARLSSVEAGGPRVLAEYVLDHALS